MSKWAKEEVLREAAGLESHGYVTAPAMLREYAALLSAQAERPSEEDVERSHKAYWDTPDDHKGDDRHAIRAALQSVRPPAEIDIELEREIFDLCKQFADPYPSWVVKHIAWLRHVFASRHTTTAPTKD